MSENTLNKHLCQLLFCFFTEVVNRSTEMLSGFSLSLSLSLSLSPSPALWIPPLTLTLLLLTPTILVEDRLTHLLHFYSA